MNQSTWNSLRWILVELRDGAAFRQRLLSHRYDHGRAFLDLLPESSKTATAARQGFVRRLFVGVPTNAQRALVRRASRRMGVRRRQLFDPEKYILLGFQSEQLNPKQVTRDLEKGGTLVSQVSFLPQELFQTTGSFSWKRRQPSPSNELPECVSPQDLGLLELEPLRSIAASQRRTGIRLAVVDAGFNLQHQALEHLRASKVAGLPKDLETSQHGTHCLSVLAGKKPVPGVLPSLEWLCLSHDFRYLHFQRTKALLRSPLAGLFHAMTWLRFGDILLLEEQRAGGVPIETIEIYHAVIRLATQAGIIVIEPAGNLETEDLDKWKPPGPSDVAISSPEHDSGAILVGAAVKIQGLWTPASCYGSRVDCWAPGDGVTAGGCAPWPVPPPKPNQLNTKTTTNFGLSSLSSSLVAGIVVMLQSVYKSQTGGFKLGPGQMRQLLRGSPRDRCKALKQTRKPLGRLVSAQKLAKELGLDLSTRSTATHAAGSSRGS